MLALGVWVFPTRVIGLWCQCLCSCEFFAALITVTIFRFNPKGSLAALSQAGSNYGKDADGNVIVTADITYADDGKMILNLWITCLVFLVAQCLLACYSAAPPTQDKLRKLGFNVNEEVNEEGQQVVRAVL